MVRKHKEEGKDMLKGKNKSNVLRLLILEDNPHDAELAITVLSEGGFVCHWDRVATRDEFISRLKT
jgi:hypothetical protein